MMDNLSIQPLAVIIVHGIAMISSYFRKKKNIIDDWPGNYICDDIL